MREAERTSLAALEFAMVPSFAASRNALTVRFQVQSWLRRGRSTVLGFTLGSLFAATAAGGDYSLWYAPSTGQMPGGNLPDYVQLFEPDERSGWSNAQSQTSVLMLRVLTLRNTEREYPGFIRSTLAPFFARSGLRLGLDTTLPNFASCPTRQKGADRKMADEIELMRRLENAGVRIAYVSMQSTLSKELPNCPEYSLQDRINDIGWYISQVRAQLGVNDDSLKFGLIDASVAKGQAFVQKTLGVPRIEDAVEKLLAELKSRGLRLHYLHLDHPWEALREFNPRARSSLTDIRDFQAWLEARGVKTGVVVTSTRSSSEMQFRDRVLEVLQGLREVGAPGRELMLTSWKLIPSTELPENPADPNRYPMTRVLNDASRFIGGTERTNSHVPSKRLH
jgi:hypothetical protein